jgi:hypothetical protein
VAQKVRRGSVRCGVAQQRCGVAQLKVRRGSVRCGVAQLVARRLAVRQARVGFSARHLMEVLLLLSEEAMRIQDDRPRRMMKDE